MTSDLYEIGQHFIVAILYDDYSGLNKGDTRLLDNFLSRFPPNTIFTPTGDINEFGLCEVTNLRGLTEKINCINL